MSRKKSKSPKETIDINSKSMTVNKHGRDEKIPLNNKQIAQILYGKNFVLRAKNENQKKLLSTINQKEITLVSGPAGTGKSHVAIGKALELLAHPDNSYQKIYLCRPTVELKGSELGFLPGNLESKLFNYIYPAYYLIDKMIGKDSRKKLVDLNIIENLALSFIKGLNIDNAVILVDESQNVTPSQMKTILTRIGYSCTMIVMGDLEQKDRDDKDGCGLEDALNRLKDIDEIGIVEFNKNDIVRNPLIIKILNKYN